MVAGGTGSKGNQLKFKERRVFLFEQIILLSEMTEKKRGNIVSAYYLFKNSLKVMNCGSKMGRYCVLLNNLSEPRFVLFQTAS